MRRRGGYTLLEVMASMVVLSCLFVAVASLSVLSFQGSHTLHRHTLAMQVAGGLLAELRSRPDRAPTPSSGTRQVQGQDFDWRVEVAEVPGARSPQALKDLRVRCSWVESGGRREVVHHLRMAFPEVRNPPPSPTPSGEP